jgi:lipopolysaccharide assembly outer membrane protein LptD (OstA)
MKSLCFFATLLFLFITGESLYSQKKDTKVIEVINADQVKYDQKYKDAQRLKGNVAFKHEGTFMYCDSALLFSKEKRFQAYGHIHVKRGDTLNIFGDSLHYFSVPKLCRLWGNIRLVEKDLQLTTDSIQFNGKENKVWYNGGATITSTSNGNKLKSKKGIYYSSSKRIYFSENVELTGKEYSLTADTLEYHTISETATFHGPTVIRSEENTIYCERGWYDTKREKSLFRQNTFIHSKEYLLKGDSILFDQKTGKGNAYGNIELQDTLNDFIINGGKADYDEKENYFLVTDSPLLSKILEAESNSEKKNDTLFVYADKMEAKQDTIAKKSWMNFYHRVKFYRKDMQGKCDSLYYNESDSLLKMFGSPVLWSEGNQVTSDTIILKTADGKVFHSNLNGNCFVISQADTVGFNQVKGKLMTVWFRDETVYKTQVIGNGQMVYYAGEKGKPFKGMNKTDCSDILVIFENEEPTKVTFQTKPDSVFYPMDKINPKDKFLKDFKWLDSERPKSKSDLFPSK